MASERSATPAHTPGDRDREQVLGDGVATVSRWVLRLLVILLGFIALGYGVQYTWSILLPVLLALLITSVLQPVSDFGADRLKLPRALSAGLTLLASLGAVVGLAFAIAPSVAGQSQEIAEDTSAGLQELQNWVQDRDFVSVDQIDGLIQELQNRIQENGGAIASGVLTGVGALGSGLITAVLALVLTFLFLKDGRKFLPFTERLVGPEIGPRLHEMLSRSWATLGGFVRTQALVSLIDAVLIGIALVIVGVPLALPLAILTFAAGFIPIAGAFAAGAISVLVALVSVGPQGALIILIVIIAVQQFEGNVLSPILQSRSMQLHPAVVILSVTLAGTLFGIIGAFLAVPIAAVAAVIIRFLDEQVREAAGQPPPEEDPAHPAEKSERQQPDEEASDDRAGRYEEGEEPEAPDDRPGAESGVGSAG